MKMDMSKFKKLKSDNNFTTLRHEDGHEIKIRHSALSPKYQKQIKSLPMYEGGQIAKGITVDGGAYAGGGVSENMMCEGDMMADGGSIPGGSGSPAVDPDKAKEIESSSQESGWQPKRWIKNIKEGISAKEAQGGLIDEPPHDVKNGSNKSMHKDDEEQDSLQDQSGIQMLQEKYANGGPINKQMIEYPNEASVPYKMADGGDPDPVPEGAIPRMEAEYGTSDPNELMNKADNMDDLRFAAQKANRPKRYAEGTDDAGDNKMIDYEKLIPQEQADKAPFGTSSMQPPVSININNGQPNSQQPSSEPLPVNTPVKEPANPQPTSQQGMPDISSSMPQDQVSPPDLMSGYQKQVMGIQGAADAQAASDIAASKSLKAQAAATQNLMSQYQDHVQSLNQERQDIQDDIRNSHIDPNHYLGSLNTGQRLMTAAGLILGGMGGGGRGNQALDFLNNQINRDIDMQKAELGKKENLLGAMMHQYGDLKDATAMTHLIMQDTFKSQLGALAAKSNSPVAKANAMQAIGQIEQAQSGPFQQFALRRMLNSSSGGTLESVDPAVLVPQLVPEAQQKDALKEISQAQNARKSKDEILKNFDQAAKENTVLSTGAGLVRTPASILAMRANMLPVIHDLEGRVTEFEQKTTSDLEPKPGDLPSKIQQKREALEHFIDQKAAAPTAKAYGIDLDKFGSTSQKPGHEFTPQQRSVAEAWARANPKRPEAAIVLQKLGIK